MHHVDRTTPWEETWQALEQLVREGKVVYVGSSNFAAWNIAQAQAAAQARHFLGLVSEQSLYNLNARMVELEVLPACRALGLGLITWSPLGGGLLGGALAKIKEGRRSSKQMAKTIMACRPRLHKYEALCAKVGAPPAHVALAWLLAQPGVTAPIIGPRTVAQLDDALSALAVRLDEDVCRKLDAIFPGPGGQAPEAYAW